MASKWVSLRLSRTLPHTVHYPSGIDSGIKMRPTVKDLDAIGPDFLDRWNSFFVKDSARDKPVLYIGSLAGCVQCGMACV